ncbi:glycoside hydrolase family 6 protein [Streptomyces sp. 6N223]|uniref:glycoside hydrolase family 6 protein n=1 Tax=Streptomyces sp. 6N223 TaxID=3457412 RepID=UPI003FD0CC35
MTPSPRPRALGARALGARALGALASATAFTAALAAALFCGSAAAGPPEQPEAPEAAARADNPYEGATVYVNPEWSANAAAVPGGSAVADEPTAVWLDSVAAVRGGGQTLGLAGHLDQALAQGADLVQLVLHDLPGRSCGRDAWLGELGPDEIDRYRAEFIDPIVETLSDPAYAGLRVVTLVEPDSLQSLVLHAGGRPSATALCEEMKANGNYLRGIGHALDRLGELPNVYPYLDAGRHGQLGWDDNALPATELLLDAATTGGATPADVHGFVVNTADYGVLREEFLSITDTVAGVSVRQSKWVDWNNYVDELPYTEEIRQRLISLGFDDGIGMVIDTSRNGWGGPDRPTGPVTGTYDLDTYVDGSRIDRRRLVTDWCNQEGAGLGARPVASPEPGIDAYAWIKPPGESDGTAEDLPSDEGVGAPDGECAEYDPMSGGPTGAMQGGGPLGTWFPEHFARLLANAHPPL